MKALATFAVIALMAAMTTATRAGAVAHVTLTVRLYNTAGVDPAELTLARDTAKAILGDGGLKIVVRPCGRAVSTEVTADRCSEPLKSAEVVVRVIDAPAFNTTLHPDAYGVTYVAKETHRGWLATVFADRVGHAAARANTSHGALLGRVMAHEVGHLLLGSGYHGPAGLMRAEWPDAILARDGADWRFSAAEAIRMHDVLVSLTDATSTETNLARADSDKVVVLNARRARP